MPNALRIALISEHASPLAPAGSVDAGGQNIYVAQVARWLASAGHEVDVLTRRDDPSLPAIVKLAPKVRVMHVEAGPAHFVPKEDLLQHMPEFARQVDALLRRGACYDVLHANFFMSGWVGLRLKRQHGLPLVTTFHALGLVRREHQGEADRFPPDRIAIEHALIHGSDRVIAECPQDAVDMKRLYGASEERLETVPCGVDTGAFRPGNKGLARRRLGLSPDGFTVLQLGRLVPRKGIDNVIRAMALLPSSLGSRLVIVGGDSACPDDMTTPEIGRLRGLARSLGVEARVHFVGRRERHELRDWYVAADVFVTTPWYEPFGITPLEAMACGTPVIGAAVGGIAHTVVDGLTGCLVPPNDPQSLAQRITHLLSDRALAREMGRAGVRRVRSMFTWWHVAKHLAEVYGELVPTVRGRHIAALGASQRRSVGLGSGQLRQPVSRALGMPQ